MAANRRARHSVPSPRGDPLYQATPVCHPPSGRKGQDDGCSECQAGEGSVQVREPPTRFTESVKAQRGTLPIPGSQVPGSPRATRRLHTVLGTPTQVQAASQEGSCSRPTARPTWNTPRPHSEWTALCLPPPSQQAPGSPLRSNTHSRWLHSGTAPSPSQVSGPGSPAASLWARSQEAKPTGQRLRSVSSTGQSCCPDGPPPGSLPCTAASSPGLPNGQQTSVLCPLPGSHRCSVFILDQTMSPPPLPAPRYVQIQSPGTWD